MCSKSFWNLCYRNLKSVFDDAAVCGKLAVIDFKIVCDELNIDISHDGCAALFQEWLGSSEKKIVFYEFCLFIACYIFNSRVSLPRLEYNCEVFLGGACNPTTWRQDTAIPFLDAVGISYYNPQVPSWSPELVEIEAQAKASSFMLLFVFEAWKTRAVSSFVEVTYLAAQSRNVVLVLTQHPPADPLMIAGEQVLPAEQACLQQARDYMCEFATALGVPLFFELPEALEYVKACVMEHRELMEKRSKRKFSSIPSVEKQFIERVLLVRKVFNSLKPSRLGTVNVEQARCGLQHLKVNFPCHSAFREHTMKTVNFEQFSMAFACYVFQHFKSASYSPSLSNLDDSENSNAALRLTCGILRHARSLCAPRDENWTQRVLRPRTSTGSFDPNNNVGPGVEHPPRRRRLPLSMSFGEQNEFTENNSPNRQLSAFKSWINAFRKRRVLSPNQCPDEPDCTAAYDLYICGSLSGDFSLLHQNCFSVLHSPVKQLTMYFADDPAPQSGSDLQPSDPKLARVWARNHSRLSLYIVNSYSFSLSTMMEAAFAIGSGLPVVLCVDQLQVNEMTAPMDGEKSYPQIFRSTCRPHSSSNQIECVTGKGIRSDQFMKSSSVMKSGSTQSSTTALSSSSWIKQASCPNDEVAGFVLSEVSSNGVESTPGSATASPLCPGVISVLNPSVDSGLGLNSDSAEFFDEHSEIDNTCVISNSLRCGNATRGKSASMSPVQKKSLPNLWEDSILSVTVSNAAAKDHNRGRVYLTSIAQNMHIPVTSEIQEALDWCRTKLSALSPS